MRRPSLTGPAAALALGCTLLLAAARADDTKAKSAPNPPAPVSFLKDVAPIFVQNCIACHNPRKAESKYVMTTFAQLAKGGAQGEDVTLEPGDPDASRLVELLKPAGAPRMPYKQDPLPADRVALVERWVKEGAKYDGSSPNEDWTVVLRKSTPVTIPDAYPAAVPVTALAFSPDGSRIAASGYHEITFWKTSDGTLDHRLRGVPERVHALAFSPDGKWLAAAGGDPGQAGSVKVWSVGPGVTTAGPPRELLDTSDSVLALAFRPDSLHLAAAGADRAVRVWDVASGKAVALIEDHADWVTDLAFSPDGKRLATASRDKTCKVFDVEKKEALATFPAHGVPVHSVVFLADGTLVASAGDDNLVRVWSPNDEAKQARQTGFGGAVFRVVRTPDGKSLVACSADKTVRVVNAVSGAVERSLTGHGDWVFSLAVSNDGKTLASGGWDGEVRLWSLADGKPIRSFVAAPGLKAGAAAH